MFIHSTKKLSRGSGSKNPNWRGVGDLGQSLWNRVLKNAAARNIPVLMTITDAEQKLHEQKWLCALSGEPLTITSTARGREMNASFDRIDASLPYTIENTQWVTKMINQMKWDFTEEYFIKICKAIHHHDKGKY